MTTTRIYRIAPANGQGAARLVRATHPATALRHVAAEAFEVRVASQDDHPDAGQLFADAHGSAADEIADLEDADA